jgi:hypothetical protein
MEVTRLSSTISRSSAEPGSSFEKRRALPGEAGVV